MHCSIVHPSLSCYLCWSNRDYLNARIRINVRKSFSVESLVFISFKFLSHPIWKKKNIIGWITNQVSIRLFVNLSAECAILEIFLNTLYWYFRRQYLMASLTRFHPRNNRLLISTKHNTRGESRYRKFDKKNLA